MWEKKNYANIKKYKFHWKWGLSIRFTLRSTSESFSDWLWAEHGNLPKEDCSCYSYYRKYSIFTNAPVLKKKIELFKENWMYNRFSVTSNRNFIMCYWNFDYWYFGFLEYLELIAFSSTHLYMSLILWMIGIFRIFNRTFFIYIFCSRTIRELFICIHVYGFSLISCVAVFSG